MRGGAAPKLEALTTFPSESTGSDEQNSSEVFWRTSGGSLDLSKTQRNSSIRGNFQQTSDKTPVKSRGIQVKWSKSPSNILSKCRVIPVQLEVLLEGPNIVKQQSWVRSFQLWEKSNGRFWHMCIIQGWPQSESIGSVTWARSQGYCKRGSVGQRTLQTHALGL